MPHCVTLALTGTDETNRATNHNMTSVVQIREEPVQSEVQGPLQEGGLETQLAHAEAYLISGQLLAAAAQLQKAVQVFHWLVSCLCVP